MGTGKQQRGTKRQPETRETDHDSDETTSANDDQTPLSRLMLLTSLIVVVGLVVMLAHWPALSAHALSLDDEEYLTSNMRVQHPSWKSAGRFLSEVIEPSTVRGYYQPLAMISLMLDYALGGRPNDLRVFHRMSLLLHVINTSLLVVFLYLLFGQPWPAAMVGLLFGVHPMTVEPIPWVGERKTLLAVFFALWCLVLYVRYARSTDWKWYAGCLVFYLLALMSKPTSIPLPVCLLLLDFWPLRRWSRRVIVEKLPFLILGGVFAVITFISQARTAAVTMPDQYAPMHLPLILCHNIIFYPYKMIWPVGLSSHYPFPDPLSLSDAMILAGVIGTCLLIPILLISLRWTRSLFVGWLFFFVAIFPTMGVIGFTNVIASDKFAYLPFVGLSLPIAWFLTRLWCAGWRKGRGGIRQVVTLWVVVFLAVPEVVATRRYLAVWRDTETLYKHMIALAPNEGILRHNLANELFRQGRIEEAWAQETEALRLYPNLAHAHNGMGVILEHKGKVQEAIGRYRKALELKPDYPQAHNNLGAILDSQGKTAEAMEHYERALQIKPDFVEVHVNMAVALTGQKRLDEAIEHCTRAIDLKTDFAKGYHTLAVALSQQGKVDAAIKHYKKALQLNPGLVLTHKNLGALLLDTGKADEAMRHFAKVAELSPGEVRDRHDLVDVLPSPARINEVIERCRATLRENPTDADAHINLANLLVGQGKFPEAVYHYREALRAEPNRSQTHNNLGNALFEMGKPDEAIAHYHEAIGLDPANADAHSNLGIALLRQGDVDGAITHFDRALALRPTHGEVRYRLATALARQGRLDQAVAHLIKVIRAKPDWAEAHTHLGVVYARQSRFDNAIVHLRKASELKPDYAEAHRNLGLVLAKIGRIEEAIQHFHKALQLQPNDAKARRGLEAALAQRHPGSPP